MTKDFYTEKLHDLLMTSIYHEKPFNSLQLQNKFEQINLLIKQGANVYSLAFGQNLLIKCICRGHKNGFSFFEYLLKFDFNLKDHVDSKEIISSLNFYTQYQDLMKMEPKKSNILNRLIELGFNVNSRSSFDQQLVINQIIQLNNIDLLKWAITNHVDVNPEKEIADATSPLHYAIEHCYMPMVQLLVEAGADIDYVNSNGANFQRLTTDKEIINYLNSVKEKKLLNQKEKISKSIYQNNIL